MNNKLKIEIAAVAGVVVLSAGGYGAWHAWDNGMIGDNPRAPTPQAMETAVRFQAAYHAKTTGARQPCLSLDLGSAQPEIVGIPGIGQQSVPGMHAATLLLQTNSRNQQVRDMQFAQFDYLAKQGLFSVVDTTITTDDGVERPAKSYRLTWKGYASGRSNYGSTLCLNYGKREFASIEHIEKTLEKMMDLEVYDVSYKTTVKGVPAWASTEEAHRHFPKLAELTGDGNGKAKVIRSHDGWRAASELEVEISIAAKGGQNSSLAEMYKKQMRGMMDVPTITLDEAKELVAKQTAETEWASRSGVPCLPLNVQRGGDEKDAQGARDAAEFAVTYYDRNDRKPYEYQTMARNLHVLAALEGAGLAEMEALRPAPPPARIGRKQPAQPVESPKPPGIRYKVNKEAMSAMGVTGYGGGCIPAGRTKIEVLALQDGYDSSQTSVHVRATIDQTPEWALKIAEGLPAFKTILENGLAMQGSLYRMPEGGAEAGKWKLNGLTPIYPTLSYDSIPAHLKPIMPLTAAAFPGKAVKAPGLVPDLRASAPAPILRVEPGYGSAGAPAAAPAPPASIDYAPAPAYKPTPAPVPVPMPKKTSSGPIYPADGSPVHVVSIYEAPLPGGAKRGFQQHPEGSVSITVSTNNATLLLFSYEPVEWKINAAKDVKLKRVVATGHYDQRIVFNGGGTPEVSATKMSTLADQSGIDPRSMSVPRKADVNGMNAVAALTQALTGALPASFQTAYTAPEAGFAIDDRTPKFALPAPRAPGATPIAVNLQGMWSDGKFINGYTVQRGSAGAYNEYWTDRAYSAGKAYFEGKLRVTGSLAAHTYANIGLCMATEKGVDMSDQKGVLALGHSEQRLYKDNDLFGVAADYDNQVVYYRVNGKWITGEPGSGSGRRLRKGMEYRACVLTSGTTSGDVERGKIRSDSTWEVNFGTKAFADPIPAGYRPYQGGA